VDYMAGTVIPYMVLVGKTERDILIGTSNELI
jgi:hypothetical protein